MSFITEQIQSLRTEASKRKCESVGKTLQRAADTIEELSAKLAAANMQQSTMFYTGGWIPLDEEHLPENGEYVLVSFANYSLPSIGRFDVDEDGDGAFYPGDEDYTYSSVGVFVNAWMPMPKSYGELNE